MSPNRFEVSFLSTSAGMSHLDPNFDAADKELGSQVQDATNRANSHMGVGANFGYIGRPFKHKDVLAIIDQSLKERIEADWQNEGSFKAHLIS